MNKSLPVLLFIFITNFWIIQTQCPTGTTLNPQGECQCNIAGKHLDIDLAATLNALDTNTSSYTSIIPDLYDFEGGTSGSCLDCGVIGPNQYAIGTNCIGTDLGVGLIYSQKTIIQSNDIGNGNSYFTAKFPGLFVFVGQINIELFYLSGIINTNGYGTRDGGELSATVNGIKYKGFFIRIYDAFIPSINHLIIVEDNGSLEHIFTGMTGFEYQKVKNLQNIPWIAYLLFATKKSGKGTYVDDSIIQQLMTNFLSSKLKKSNCTRSCPSTCDTCISYFSCRECVSPGKYPDGNECKGMSPIVNN